MPHHFPQIKAQLALDLTAVLSEYGPSPTVKFGQPRKPIRTYPYAVVRTAVSRDFDGVRSVEESYGFEIEMRIALPDPETTEIEEHVLEAADRLIQRLAPYDPAAVPAECPDYAGVGYSRHVSMVVPGEEGDTDPFCSVKVGFGLKTIVYQ